MSETTQTAAPVQRFPPGMTVVTKMEGDEMLHLATFGTPPRSVSVVDLDMGAQFDLAEVTGGTDNLEYRNLAFVAASVRSIDGVPTANRASMSKASLRDTLKRLGRDGTKAATAIISSFADDVGEPDFKAAAGNS